MTEELAYSLFHDVLLPKIAVEDKSMKTLSLRRSIRHSVSPNFKLADATYVVFDFETTGLDYNRDRIIEIGAQKIKGKKVIGEISTLIHTEMEIPKVVQELTGITPNMLVGQPPIDEFLPKFLDFMHGSILVAHNAEFDLSFLSAECSRLGIDIEWPVFCTLKLSRELLPDLERKNLDTLAEFYNLTFESRHRSIGDVKVTASVLQEMLKNEGDYMEYWRDMEPFTVISKA
ncbi:MAG: exonuclease domain-containing protein [Bdellovibrionota bacterium]